MGDHDQVVGFWSYAREDNRLDGDAILNLSAALQDEFDLISGRPLKIFIDRESISWGEEWRQRIDSALTSATFLIPIITPRYFTRPECRRELLDFYGRARSFGLEQLVLPILYIDIGELSSDNSDEAIAVVGRTQYVDWRELRLEGPASTNYRRAVHQLAKRLHEIEGVASKIQLSRELDPGSDEEPGLQDLIEEIDSALPDWLSAVWGDTVNSAQMRATYDQHKERIRRLRARRSPNSAILATQLRFGPDMLPLVERFHTDGQVYVARTSQLNPLMLKLIRHLDQYPQSAILAHHILEGLSDAIENIISSEYKTNPEYLNSLAHLSHTLRRTAKLLMDTVHLAHAANEIVVKWWNMGLGEILEGDDFRPIVPTGVSNEWAREGVSDPRIIDRAVID
ncbi:toll/interleukin-1 receptor domain-containing protein [Micromonospora sp. CPCC 205539]|uniref:toll/interleukin-1 receptor domain-containing protein n=1 Tax=Micromonospora sp. CPCC 205539 TaxID=3122408 RepID=UPI002FEED82A